MARSPGFGCRHTHCAPCSGSLSLRLRLFDLTLRVCTDSQAHSSIGTASDFNVLRHLVSTRFQDLFHSPHGVLFTFPSRYLYAIGSQIVFSLRGRSPGLRSGFHVSRLTLSRWMASPFGYGALTPFGSSFQRILLGSVIVLRIWAAPLSLATTHGIDLSFFSSGYLDVSVPRACSMLGSPIRKSRDLSSRPAPPGLSQVVASFIAVWLQGIRRVPYKLLSM